MLHPTRGCKVSVCFKGELPKVYLRADVELDQIRIFIKQHPCGRVMMGRVEDHMEVMDKLHPKKGL